MLAHTLRWKSASPLVTRFVATQHNTLASNCLYKVFYSEFPCRISFSFQPRSSHTSRQAKHSWPQIRGCNALHKVHAQYIDDKYCSMAKVSCEGFLHFFHSASTNTEGHTAGMHTVRATQSRDKRTAKRQFCSDVFYLIPCHVHQSLFTAG